MGANSGEVARNRGVRTLPYPEYVRRREKDRCFHCGGPYSYGTVALIKNLPDIIGAEDEDALDTREQGEKKLERRFHLV